MLQPVTKLVLTVRSKGAFWRFTDFQRGKYSFSSPIPSMQHCAAVQATLAVENNKHPNFEWRGGERGVDSFVLCSYPIWVHVSIILLPIVWIAKWPYMLKKTNSTHLFSLGYKTLGGTFFCYDWCNHAYFKKILLEYGYFIIFSAMWHFMSHLTCLDIMQCGVSHTISYSFLYRIKEQSKKDRKQNSCRFFCSL